MLHHVELSFALVLLVGWFHTPVDDACIFGHSQGLPELVHPMQAVLSHIRPMDSPALPVVLQERHLKLQRLIAELADSSLQSRNPLRWQSTGVQAIKVMSRAPCPVHVLACTTVSSMYTSSLASLMV